MQPDNLSYLSRASNAKPTLAIDLLESNFEVTSSPFCSDQIRLARENLERDLEAASLRAQLRASELATVELFCLLAQAAPEFLPASWSTVYDMVVAEERYWVYPSMTVADIEDGECDFFTPYLDRPKLSAEWRGLLEHVQTVISAQKSAKQYALTA